METLVGSTGVIRFPVPSGLNNATFVVKRNGVQVGNPGNASISNGVAACDLPYAAVAVDGEVTVTLTFTFEAQTYNREERVSVVTPILSTPEIQEILGGEATEDEIHKIERAVRHVINAYTGQEFRPYVGSLTVRGSGYDSLTLPRRLVSATTINGKSGQTFIERSGYSLYGYQDFDYWNWQYEDNSPFEPEKVSHGEIIATTPRGRYRFVSGEQYVVTGLWGWESVPAPVQEAARLLVNDYACGDAAYRDRYLESIRSADWRLGFSPLAYQGTGNVRADQLLADYIMPNMGVI